MQVNKTNASRFYFFRNIFQVAKKQRKMLQLNDFHLTLRVIKLAYVKNIFYWLRINTEMIPILKKAMRKISSFFWVCVCIRVSPKYCKWNGTGISLCIAAF